MEDKIEDKEYPIMRCSKEFKDLIEDLMQRWEERYGFRLSSTEATNIIVKKISAAGGIRL